MNFSEESPVSSGYSVTDILHQQEGHQPLLYSGPYSGQNPTSEELYRSQVGILFLQRLTLKYICMNFE